MSTAKIKLGIIGYGNSAKNFHLPLIIHVPDIEVHAILQRTPPAPDAKPGEHCTVDLPGARHYTDVDSFFADPEIELVLVAVAAMHYEYAKRALLAGKNVVVEKAFTTTSEEADDLIQTAQTAKKIVTVYHNRRFDGDFLTVKQLIKNRVLGDLIDFETHFDWDDPGWPSNWADVKEYIPGKGTLFGLGSHTADQVLSLFGRPENVFAVFRAHRDGSRGSAIDDWHTLILQYPGADNQGLVVTIRSTQISPLAKQLRFFVRGRQGAYIKFYHDVQEAHVTGRQFSSPLDPRFGKEDASHFGELTTTTMYDASFQTVDESGRQPRYVGKMPTEPGNWRGYYQNIARALRGQEELEVTAEHGRDVIRLFELARESARTGRSVPWS
ncbi:hypothetical protein B0T10DRAFT_579797 [Thelonectria olida]|uniref:Oxidoreductase n=1 Tax=Thelonectria olida TaxID=1576542 RepID=A0A9P8VXH4_9HYPO|nr:hypothetical protein B0T10DRAFT_579797 [Thelonectria olida]